MKNLKEIFVFESHSDIVSCLAFSRDNSLALSGSLDGTVKLLDLLTCKTLHTFHHEAPVKAATFAENTGRVITFSDDKIIHIWDRSTSDKVTDFPILGPGAEYKKGRLGSKYVLSAAFSTDGKHILAGCQNKVIYLLPVSPGARSRRLVGHELPVFGVGFTGKDALVYSFSQYSDTTLRLWDTNNRKETKCLTEKDHFLNAIVSPDGSYAIISLANGKVNVWNVLSGKFLFDLSKDFFRKERFVSLSFHKDNRHLLAGSSEGTIHLWNIENRKQLAEVKAHEGEVNQILFSPDGQFALSSAGKDHYIKFWELTEN
jgi:WD40 repeat protein